MKSLITAVSLLALTTANVAPGVASAQGYGAYPPPPPPAPACQRNRTDSTVLGAVIGAGLGALLGAALAAEGHGGDGAALGAGFGGITGGLIGSSSTKCPDGSPSPPPPHGASVHGPGYGQDRFDSPSPLPPSQEEFNEPPPGSNAPPQ